MVEKINYFRKILEDLKGRGLYRTEKIFFRLTRFPGTIFNSDYIRKKFFQPKRQIISFASNNYLNLCENQVIAKAGVKALKKYGTGAVSSKFIEGYNLMYKNIELTMNKMKGVNNTLIFNSGYLANLGIFSSLFKKGDVIFLDELSHASSFEGAKLSGASIIRYAHNNIKDLEEKITKYGLTKEIGIATETIFSMRGSVLANSDAYIDLAKKHNAIFITDEAHSFGVMELKFSFYPLHIKMGTFSKAIGALGGYVCGDAIIIDIIRNFSKSGIYTTALPPSVLASISAALQLLEKGYNGKKALENANFFSKLFGLEAASQILFIETEKGDKVSQDLLKEGFFLKSIKKPTVKKNGIRISFNNLHKKVDIQKLAFILKDSLS